MEQPIISLKNVSYAYPHATGDHRAALSDITLDIQEGDFIGLVGANGSGKSTLARMLNALLVPVEGEIRVDGMLTSDKANHDRIRETAGMVFQNPDSQIVATSVEDDIAFGLENLGLPVEEIERRIADVARRFDVADLLEREPHWLSGGQKQRVVLAGVVAIKPRILILDEPTSMLDPRSRRQFHSLVKDLWRGGVTVIYITQLMDELALADRMLALDAGRVVFDGKPLDIFSNDELLERISLEAPLAVRLARTLARRGCKLSPVPLTLGQLVEEICG